MCFICLIKVLIIIRKLKLIKGFSFGKLKQSFQLMKHDPGNGGGGYDLRKDIFNVSTKICPLKVEFQDQSLL